MKEYLEASARMDRMTAKVDRMFIAVAVVFFLTGLMMGKLFL